MLKIHSNPYLVKTLVATSYFISVENTFQSIPGVDITNHLTHMTSVENIFLSTSGKSLSSHIIYNKIASDMLVPHSLGKYF